MKLSQLLDRLFALHDITASCEVSGVAFDSRKVIPGTVFVAIDGLNDNGSRYIGDALARGAVAVVSESPAGSCPAWPADRPWIQVAQARKALAQIACAVYGDPSREMRVYGVTGTNGKTTTAGLVRDCLRAAGTECGLLSTVENAFPGFTEEASRTTPDPVTIQKLFSEMLAAGCGAVSMEASSHALDQFRTGGIRFAAAGFTNLSRDHFDYHHNFEEYFAAKCLLFRQLGEENPGAPGVVNAEDPYGRRLLDLLPEMNVRPVAYAIDGEADIRARDVVLGARQTRFTLCVHGKSAEIKTGLLGRYNVMNLLCVAGMMLETGVEFETVCRALAGATPRWGRLEKVAEYRGASVFVDYAHTPDAIEKVLVALREITERRLVIVFGCGGDRDRAKRPQMAAMAAKLADSVILTSDNPRTEDPLAIIEEAAAGFAGASTPHVKIPDRREAIAAALDAAAPGDCIVIAGKGHETYQEINGVKHHFDDRETVRVLCSGF